MGELNIHPDRTLMALVHGGREPWTASPEPGVERRLLERIGGEVALASSIVRYRPGSRFTAHSHDLGEEFLVLDGTFSDEHGHYSAGTYVRNAPGSRHAPFSDPGCVIFVKLRQMNRAETLSPRVFVGDRVWAATQVQGHDRAPLFSANGVSVQLQRLAAGVELPLPQTAGGTEVFVVEGSVRLLAGAPHNLLAWSWLRWPASDAAESCTLFSPHGAMLWVKRGHLRSGGNGDC